MSESHARQLLDRLRRAESELRGRDAIAADLLALQIEISEAMVELITAAHSSRPQRERKPMPPATPKCRSCNAEIIWAKTQNGKNCCYDTKVTSDRPGGPGTPVVPVYSIIEGVAVRCKPGEEGHASHFSTCPNANQHSKGGGEKR